MRAAIYNPYLDTLGGGERYTIAFAQVLSGLGYSVDVQWTNFEIREKLEERFGRRLNEINFVPEVKKGDGYEICFWVSDGSVPLLRARKNFLHFQIPFTNVNGKSLLNKMKFFRINKVICNSFFTKKIIDREFGIESVVIYPPVDVKKIKPKRKENIILNVSRFSNLTQAKRQDVLVDTFVKLCKKNLLGWKLILAGGVEVGTDDLIDYLTKNARGYPIEIIKSPDFKTVRELYGKARIYWSASGFGFDEAKNPDRVEHFGISIVEAMSAKVIPIVFNAGGHKEIIEDKVCGFLWNTTRDLQKITRKLITDLGYARKIQIGAHIISQKFSYERFAKEVSEAVG